MDRRVVVTGVGLITPLGLTVDDNVRALRDGVSGIRPINSFDCRSFPVKIAGEVKGFDPARYVAKRKSLKLMNRTIEFAVSAVRMAVDDAGICTEHVDASRFGVSLGMEGTQYAIDEVSSAFRASTDDNEGFDLHKCGAEGYKVLNPLWPLTILPNMSLCHVAINLDARGPNMTFCSLASAGAQAIGEAVRSIERGEADIFVAGGSDMVNPVTVVYLALQDILSPQSGDPEAASRPFDRDRDGVVVGEGAGVVILEELQYAKERGADIYGEITGYSSSIYGDRLTSKKDLFLTSVPGAAACMAAALRDAGLNSCEVDYINADGQSSVLADRAETAAIREVFGECAGSTTSVSSTKSMMGHLLCASGAVETVIGLLSIKHGFVPPTINHDNVDEECALDYTPNRLVERPINTVMTNSFGFGGENTSLIVERY